MSWSPKRKAGRRAARSSREHGAVAVEFALVLPLVIVLLLGTVTAGVAYSHKIGLTNAVREGARFGAVTVSDASWPTAVVARTRQTQFDDFSTPAATSVCAALIKNAGASAAVPTTTVWASPCPAGLTAPTPPSVDGGKCVSVVWASRPYEIQTGLRTFSGAMKPKSVAFYERTC